MSACLDCAWFAGRERDHQATLFRMGKGYCNNPEHLWGIWNVIQEITKNVGAAFLRRRQRTSESSGQRPRKSS